MTSPVPPASLAAATFRWFTDHAAEGILITDAGLRITTWNQWLETVTGISADDAVGGPLFEVVPALRERAFDAYYAEALKGEVKILSHALHRYIIPSVRKYNGEHMPQTSRIAPLVHDGAVVGTITVITDVSERVLTERELRAQIATAEEARHTAEQASRVKDEFLATLSHEIRTPLNAVLGWTRILRSREPDPATLARAIEVIDRNATAQLTLVTDMLDMARITAGKVRLEIGDVDIAMTLQAAIETVTPAADAKGIAIATERATAVPLVRGDGERLLQVFWNLLSNAVKFTEDGGSITVRLVNAAGQVQVSITDTGPGISAEFIPQLFQRFKQADPSAARRHGGLGLGLALVREIVHMHGGSVDVFSEGAQKGTTFTVSLPVRFARTTRQRPLQPPLLTGVHVLVVEDDPDAQEIVMRAVTSVGASAAAAGSVAEALSRLRDGQQVRPSVVVADIGLPDADGYALLSQVRRLSAEEGGTLPVIAVTAYVSPEERRAAIDAGFYAHLPKPLVPEALVQAIARAVAASARAGSAPPDDVVSSPSRRLAP
jgi:PAS domain S-box-containing protein